MILEIKIDNNRAIVFGSNNLTKNIRKVILSNERALQLDRMQD